MLSDREYIDGFFNNDSSIIKEFYKSEYSKVLSYIVKNSGSREDANDIAQEGIISLFTNIKLGKYEQQSKTRLSSYYIQICKFKWLDHLKSAHFKRTSSINDFKEKDNLLFETHSEIEIDDQRIKNLHKAINKMGSRCKGILKAFYWEKKKLSEIAATFKLSHESAKNAKYRCLKKIRSLIK